METKLIRCVSTKPNKQSGEYRVTFLSPAVVNNRHFMKKYGWKVEELKEEKLKEVKLPKEEVESHDMNLVAPEEFTEVPPVEFIETPRPVEQEAKPKATRKPRAGKPRKTTKQ